MINSLRIQNFKCWKDTGEIELAPLTILFGSNSSGKSSIGQCLMMLKQSIEQPDRKSVFFTGNENTAIDLGVASDLVYNRDLSKSIKVSYKWTNEKGFGFTDAIHQKTYSIQSIKFNGEIAIREPSTQSMEVTSTKYTLYQKNGLPVKVGMEKKQTTSGSRRSYMLTSDNYDFVRSSGRVWDIPAPIRFYGFPDEAVAYYQNANFLQSMNLQQEKLFSNIYYLGPLRTRAKRLYTWSGQNPASVGFLGEEAISALLAAKDEERFLNLKYKGKRKAFEAVIAEMLKKMNLIEEFKVEKISDYRQDYDVKVKTKGSDNWVDIPDVGIGISQVLPVIVELFFAPQGSTIIMEQPELHLHPSAQAGLADVIIDAIHARENYENRNIQLIIETHSEHFLRRLQRRIAEAELGKDELRAYFANNNTQPAELEPLQVNLFGDIINWPTDFFGDITGDIFAQTEAALKRRIKESQY